MIRAVVLTPYQRVTDGQTDEIAIASTALAKRRAVKIARPNFTKLSVHGRGSEVARSSSDDNAYTSGFVDDVMFSHNGPKYGCWLGVWDVANYSPSLARWRR